MTVAAGAQHVVSRLMRESLMDKTLIAGTESPVRAILPNLNVIQIGGLSIMDRGHAAVLPLIEEIVANQESHTQVVGVGPGVRARHILSVGLDLGLPTGALATLAAKSSAQNAYMVSCLLASHGFVYLEAPFVVQLLPAMLAAARGAVFNGIRPTTCGSIRRRSARFRRTAATPARTSWARCSARARSSCSRMWTGSTPPTRKRIRTPSSSRRSARGNCCAGRLRPCRSSRWCWS
jgi:hypothetical protein